MRLEPINGPRIRVTCVRCSGRTWSDKAVADLDGAPFRDYYCEPCAAELRANEHKGGNA